jgi:predicted nucleic acid-binding protein
MKSDLWDTSALLALQCETDDFHAAAEAAFDGSCSAARRSRAEFYCAATGRMGVPPEATLALLESLDAFVEWVPLSDADEARVIKSAPKRGLQGRILFDALIAECAVNAGAKTVVTANPTHFRHALPHTDIIDLTIQSG